MKKDMTAEQKEKVKVLEDFLKENNISYFANFKSKKHGIKGKLYVTNYRIIVKLSEGKEKDDKYYQEVKFLYHPLFIRKEETPEFVLTKMQNLIIDLMKRQQERFTRSQEKCRCQ